MEMTKKNTIDAAIQANKDFNMSRCVDGLYESWIVNHQKNPSYFPYIKNELLKRIRENGITYKMPELERYIAEYVKNEEYEKANIVKAYKEAVVEFQKQS